MAWNVEVTDEFLEWYDRLDEGETKSVRFVVDLLEEQGPSLPHPYSAAIVKARLGHLRELRAGKQRPLRILYAFDPLRTAILLLGGDKGDADRRWYDRNVPKAEAIYEEYLAGLRREGKLK